MKLLNNIIFGIATFKVAVDSYVTIQSKGKTHTAAVCEGIEDHGRIPGWVVDNTCYYTWGEFVHNSGQKFKKITGTILNKSIDVSYAFKALGDETSSRTSYWSCVIHTDKGDRLGKCTRNKEEAWFSYNEIQNKRGEEISVKKNGVGAFKVSLIDGSDGTPVDMDFIRTLMQNRLLNAGAEASSGKGSIAISLLWDNSVPGIANDLDLWVTQPLGEKIYYNHKQSSKCDGTLDVDRVQSFKEPIENIILHNDCRGGNYKIEVHNFSTSHSSTTTKFYISIVEEGGKMEIIPLVMPGRGGSVVHVRTINRP